MNNSDMKEGRFLRWAKARKLVSMIRETLASGGEVIMFTHTRATRYNKNHVDWFVARKSGAFVRRNKHFDCIDYCGFQFIKNEV